MASKEEFSVEDMSQFDWVQLKQDMDKVGMVETRQQKLWRKINENPFVPIGALATTTALCIGLYSFKTGKRKLSQYMMRTRVAAQGFTVFALVFGIGMSAKRVAEIEHTKESHPEM